jgi:hypothetical protein
MIRYCVIKPITATPDEWLDRSICVVCQFSPSTRVLCDSRRSDRASVAVAPPQTESLSLKAENPVFIRALRRSDRASGAVAPSQSGNGSVAPSQSHLRFSIKTNSENPVFIRALRRSDRASGAVATSQSGNGSVAPSGCHIFDFQ